MIVQEHKLNNPRNLKFKEISALKETLLKQNINPKSIETTLNKISHLFTKFLDINNLNEEVSLQFNIKPLHTIKFEEFFQEMDKLLELENNKPTISVIMSMLSFICVKYLSQLTKISNPMELNTEEIILKKLNNEFSKNSFNSEIFYAYNKKLFEKDINHIYENIIKGREKYLINDIETDIVNRLLRSENILEIFKIYINQISFIHYNEYLITIESKCTDENIKFSLSLIQLNLLMTYLKLSKNNTGSMYNSFQYNEVLIYFLKYTVINLLDRILSMKETENALGVLIEEYLHLIFEVEVKSKEVYIFSILALLIIYLRFLKQNSKSCKQLIHILDTSLNTLNPNLILARKILKSTKTDINAESLIEVDMILFIKLMEFHLIKKYNKDLQDITTSDVNVNDFIIQNLFIYENVYDDIRKVYFKFKDKIYWNFGEILINVYSVFPKILKKTLFRHLQYMPHQDSLVSHIVQYYYSNKDYRKSKILIRKILMKQDDESDLLFDIQTICLFIIVNILIYEEDLCQALDLAIYNLERLKSNKTIKDEQILMRAYFMLGFCYSKHGDEATNYEEKIKYFHLALSCFKSTLERDNNKNINNENKIYKENPVFIYNYSKQLYDCKLFSLADENLRKLEELDKYKTFNSNQYFYSLRILINISQLKFDDALKLCDLVLHNNPLQTLKFNILVILKFYLLIMKLINEEDEQKNEDSLIKKMLEYLNLLFTTIDDEIKNLDKNIEKITNLKKLSQNEIQFDKKQTALKEIAKFGDFEPFLNDIVTDDQIKASVKIYFHEKKNLENLRVEIIKNFYLLTDILMDNGYDACKKLDESLMSYNLKSSSQVQNEDNLLLIRAIQLQMDKKFSDAENLYKRILEMNPSNMTALKRLSKLLINKKDFSNAYIYIIKAIKLDEEESEMWNMLSIYYMENGDDAKYYECVLKQIDKSKFHTNSFLNGLIPKVII